MLKNPQASILISSYNKGNYLEKCIKSCLSQTHKNIEVVLLDNCSNDKKTRIILKKFSKKIKILKKKRISKFPALNQIDLLAKAFKVSKGSIIYLLDADDFFSKNKIKNINNIFKTKNKVGVIFDIPIIKDKNSYKKMKIKTKTTKNIWPTIIPTSSIAMRRSFFKKYLRSDNLRKFNLLEIDFRINVLAFNIKKNFLVLSKNLTYYRVTKNSIMDNTKKYSKKWWFKRKQAHEYMFKLFKKNNVDYKNLDFSVTNIFNYVLKII